MPSLPLHEVTHRQAGLSCAHDNDVKARLRLVISGSFLRSVHAVRVPWQIASKPASSPRVTLPAHSRCLESPGRRSHHRWAFRWLRPPEPVPGWRPRRTPAVIASPAPAARSAPAARRPRPIQIAESSSAPMLISAETPRLPSVFMTTTRQSPSSGSHSSVCSPEPDDVAVQNSWSPGGLSGSPPCVRVSRPALEVRHDVVLDTFEVVVDLGLGADPDEHRAVALTADTHRSEEGVECPLGAVGVDVRALGHDRVRRCPEVLGWRHQEAVVVALYLVDGDKRASASEQAEGEDCRDAADNDQDDPARSASSCAGSRGTGAPAAAPAGGSGGSSVTAAASSPP